MFICLLLIKQGVFTGERSICRVVKLGAMISRSPVKAEEGGENYHRKKYFEVIVFAAFLRLSGCRD
jgi:hypothetical protein